MGIYRPRSFGLFDPTKPLVAGRQMELGEHSLQGGDPIPDDVEDGIKRRLWLVEHAHYVDDWTPTPEEVVPVEGEPEPDDKGVTYAHTGGGWYEVTAPWLSAPVKVKGEDAAKAKAEELRAEAPSQEPTEGEGGNTGSGEGGEGGEGGTAGE